MKMDFFSSGVCGFVSGRREIGGAPKETQWMRLKQPVRMLSSDSVSGVVDSMWQYKREATAPPAECPVIRSEYFALLGFSWSKCRSRAATGFTIFLATVRNPAWQRFPGSS